MTEISGQPLPRVAIACGGTGGHLFPGLAVAEELRKESCEVTIIISEKEIDRQAAKNAVNGRILALPAVGLTRGGRVAFARGFMASCFGSSRYFRSWHPDGVLAMGGFTSAPPAITARLRGAAIFLHESNAVPGRANRWLSWMTERAFIGFESARKGLHAAEIAVTGTPVRPEFRPGNPEEARRALGLEPGRPVLLVTGGSQGAMPLNRLLIEAMPLLLKVCPELQCLHLTGAADAEQVRQAYAVSPGRAVVHPFLDRMDLALCAATVAIARAGASSLAELAAMRVPSLLVPFPSATDNHQVKNALAYSESGAAMVLEQRLATPQELAHHVGLLVNNPEQRQRMQQALAGWHTPEAARRIACCILEVIEARRSSTRSRRGAGPSTESLGGSKQARREKVAQVSTLLYRGFPTRRPSATRVFEQLPIGNRRSSRLETCATTLSTALWRSVSSPPLRRRFPTAIA